MLFNFCVACRGVRKIWYPPMPSVLNIFLSKTFHMRHYFLSAQGGGKEVALMLGVGCKPYELYHITRAIKCVVLIAYFKLSIYHF